MLKVMFAALIQNTACFRSEAVRKAGTFSFLDRDCSTSPYIFPARFSSEIGGHASVCLGYLRGRSTIVIQGGRFGENLPV